MEPKWLNWREMPFVRLLLFLVLGISLSRLWNGPLAVEGCGVGLIVVALVLVGFLARRTPFRWQWVLGIGLSVWVLLLGAWRSAEFAELNHDDHFSQLASPDSSYYFQVRVAEEQVSGDRLRLRTEVLAFRSGPNEWIPVSGNLLWYIAADEGEDIQPGTRLLGEAKIQPVRGTLNPSAFDFAAYQSRQNVHFQARAERVQVLGHDFHLGAVSQQWRQELLQVLRDHLPVGSNELAVGAALILGERKGLQQEVRNAYADTGAIHVLAVSGLHVGFIAYGLSWLLGLGFLGRRRWRWLRLGCVLLGIWLFALITGLSPSVQRAATMFSFLQLGLVLDRRSSIYNTLAASAFLLLLINPLLLVDIGFQLSYLAVGGIVFFQRRLYRLWYPPNRLFDHLWTLLTVAIAAQLTTFPISLFYFHQFPLYFWLSGWVVVSTAVLILGLGMLLLAVHWIPILSMMVGKALYWIIWMTNAVIFGIQSLPGGLLAGVWIGITSLVLLYIFVTAIGIWSVNKRAKPLLVALSSLAIVLILQVHQSWQQSQQQELTIYQVFKETIVDGFNGREGYTWSSLAPDAPAVQWAAKNHRERRGIRTLVQLPGIRESDQGANYWYHQGWMGWAENRLLIIDGDAPPQWSNEARFQADLVLLRASPRLQLPELQQHIQAETWVFDGSNYPSFVDRWLEDCETLGLNCHATSRDGAFTLIQE